MNFEMQPYKVLVKTDAEGRITAINSDAFINDLTDWNEIDNGFGDKYHHAQGNYFAKPIMDDRGIYAYKLVDGAPVERTIEEMDADYVEPIIEQSNEELLLEMAADHEYRLCLIELGVTESDL